MYVDGETFPSHFGTGTEDYYGYAWGRYEPWINHPFVAQPIGDGCYAHIGLAQNTRVRSFGCDSVYPGACALTWSYSIGRIYTLIMLR